MSPLVLIPLPGNEPMAAGLARALHGEVCRPGMRTLPDGETDLRLERDLHGRAVALVCALDRPDAKFLPLLFAAGTASELGAASVGLVAPYLAYMRRAHRGEARSAKLFASLLSPHIDWLVTVDPHLHRVHALQDIYGVPASILDASGVIARWIAREIAEPVLVGPDGGSVPWLREVAETAGAPVVVPERAGPGDRGVVLPDLSPWRGRTPVLVGDVVSAAMLETLAHLRDAGMKPAVCIGVHAIFAPGAYDALRGFARIVTTNMVTHESNAIDLSEILAGGIREVAR